MTTELFFYGPFFWVKYWTSSKIRRDNKHLQTLTVYSDFRTGQFLLCKYHAKSMKADVNCLLGSTSSATHDPRKNIAPSFSFGVRHKEYTNNHSPGPKFNIESSLTRHGRSGAPHVINFIDFINSMNPISTQCTPDRNPPLLLTLRVREHTGMKIPALLTKLLQPTRSPDEPSLDILTKLQVRPKFNLRFSKYHSRTCCLFAAPSECE